MPLGYADKVRNYTIQLVESARRQGKTKVHIRAGDVRDTLGIRFVSDIYDICQVLNTKKFRMQARVEFLRKTGLAQGMNTTYEFRILGNSHGVPGVDDMSQADEIRRYADKRYVTPARLRDEQRVTIRAGTVREEMRLPSDRVAAVGGSLDTEVFERFANVRRVDYFGVESRRGADANFVFEILPVYKTELDDTLDENLRERILELTPSEFQELAREYLKAKGFDDAEIEVTIRMKM